MEPSDPHDYLVSQLKELDTNPLNHVVVRKDNPSNGTFHLAVFGLDDNEYRGGLFYSTLLFPIDPLGMPSVCVFTPNPAITPFLPKSLLQVDSAWKAGESLRSVASRVADALIRPRVPPAADLETRKALARSSLECNKDNPRFNDMFSDILDWYNSEGPRAGVLVPPVSQIHVFQRTPFLAPLATTPVSSPMRISGSSALTRSLDSSTGSLSSSPSLGFNSFSASPSNIESMLAQSPSKDSFIHRTSPPASPPIKHVSTASLSSLKTSGNANPIEIEKFVAPARTAPLDEQRKVFDTAGGKIAVAETICSLLKGDVAKWTNSSSSTVILPKLIVLGFSLGPAYKDQVSEQEKSMIFCSCRADFTAWEYLKSDNLEIETGEETREHARELVVNCLDAITAIAWREYGLRVTFAEISLARTEGSMRAVFQGTSGTGQTMHRETEVQVLDLSHTRTSPRSLLSLHRLINLRELYLEYCPSIQKSGKHVFSLLVKKDPIPSLECLSVVGTSQVMSHQWLADVEQRCPNIKRVFFSRKPGMKAIGWQDVILMQTMRDPQLLPCGHIGDKQSALSVGYCGFDRETFRSEELLPVNPAVTVLIKSEAKGKWTATIVDVLRETLDGKVLYHHCGHFFNLSSIVKLFPMDPEPKTLDEAVLTYVRTQTCPGCGRSLQTARFAFPHSAEPLEKHYFDNLKSLGAYGVDFSGTETL